MFHDMSDDISFAKAKQLSLHNHIYRLHYYLSIYLSEKTLQIDVFKLEEFIDYVCQLVKNLKGIAKEDLDSKLLYTHKHILLFGLVWLRFVI